MILKIKVSLKNSWISSLFIAMLLVLFAWFVSIGLAPYGKIQELHHLVDTDTVFIEKFDSVFYHPEMTKQLSEKGFREALLRLSDNDSIQLIVNLSDSSVCLSIKGVIIQQTKASQIYTDKLFAKMTGVQRYRLFSQPLQVNTVYASIVKEPVVVRQAPKDTMEAELNAWQPDTLIQNPAFVALSIEYGIHINLEQERNLTWYDKRKKVEFYTHLLFTKTKSSLKHFIGFKKQEYQPVITIKLPVDDLRAIYRALPYEPYVVFKL
jgi:hypothetical protein